MTSTARPTIWGHRTEKKTEADVVSDLVEHVAALEARLAALEDRLPQGIRKGSPAERRKLEEMHAQLRAADQPRREADAAAAEVLRQRQSNPYHLTDAEYAALPDHLRMPLEAARQRANTGEPAAIQAWGHIVEDYVPKKVAAALIAAGLWGEHMRQQRFLAVY